MPADRSRTYRKTKRGHLATYLDNAKARAKAKQIAFDLDLDFLESIATDEGPIFKTPFVWGVTETELYAVADWLHEKRKEVLRAEEEKFASVSNDFSGEGEVYPELGSFSASWPWQDSDDTNDHSGTDAGQDTDNSSKKGS